MKIRPHSMKPYYMCLFVMTYAFGTLAFAESQQEKESSFLVALKDFNFEKFHSNLVDIKTISFNPSNTVKNSKSESVAKESDVEEPIVSSEPMKQIPKPIQVQPTEGILAQSAPARTPTAAPSLNQNFSTPSPNQTAPAQPQPRSYTQPRNNPTYPTTNSARVPAIGSANSPYAFHSYRLSYMQSDRTIALLKALGYSTVEYSAGRGESVNESIFTSFQQSYTYPIIVKVLDAAKTSLMQPALDGGYNPSSATDRLSGTYLHQSTSGAPEQRLLIIYEKQYPEQLNALLNLLRTEVDVAASQIVIEALVVEINSDKRKELGLEYDLVDKRYNLSMTDGVLSSSFNSSQRDKFKWNSSRFTGSSPETFWDNTSASWKTVESAHYGVFERTNPLSFEARLNAFISDGTAEVLTNPTILVLDGRQAMIRIGTQIPNATTNSGNGYSVTTFQYINTGIVLNIRPRISEDGSEVTMQTETIVSSAGAPSTVVIDDKAVQVPPVIESKTVQSFVRVADNTPFIIGGLIDKKKDENEIGIPVLSDIPVIGNLFKKKSKIGTDREVIIVLTPHIIDTKEKSFSYVIPKDSETFDSFDNVLFRNAYRIRDDDLFDLSFATQSEYFQNILKELQSYKSAHPEISEDDKLFTYLNDRVPGEEVIVRRMIWEIVHKSKYHQYIADDHILLFESHEEATYGNKFKTHLLNLLMGRLADKPENSLVLNFADHKARSKGPFEHPRSMISLGKVSDPGNYVEQMSKLNALDPNRNTLLLCPEIAPPGVRGANALEVLKGVLVLKRILALNSSMPVTINEFRVGRQIIFPTEQELKDKYHVIDYDTVRFFYEVINYYPEFENAFNRDSEEILRKIRSPKR